MPRSPMEIRGLSFPSVCCPVPRSGGVTRVSSSVTERDGAASFVDEYAAPTVPVNACSSVVEIVGAVGAARPSMMLSRISMSDMAGSSSRRISGPGGALRLSSVLRCSAVFRLLLLRPPPLERGAGAGAGARERDRDRDREPPHMQTSRWQAIVCGSGVSDDASMT